MKQRQKKKLAGKLHGPFDFRKELVELPRPRREVRTRTSPRQFKSIAFNDGIKFSIQASNTYYCLPQATTQVYAYRDMEVAFFKEGKRAPVHKVTTNQSLIKRFEEYEALPSDTEDYSDCLYGYVPVPLIQEMYADLLVQKGLKRT